MDLGFFQVSSVWGSFFSLKKKLEGTEQALKESTEKFRHIVENSNDAIILTRPDGNISYMSPAAKSVIGYDPQDLEGTKPNFFHPDDVKIVMKKFQCALKGESGNNIEYRIITKNGETRWISHSWSPIYLENSLKPFNLSKSFPITTVTS